MLIAIDVDDVLANLSKAITRHCKQIYGLDIKEDDIYCSDWWIKWKIDDKEAAMKLVEDFINDKNLDNILPIDGAQEAVRRLREKNDLVIVTGRPSVCMGNTKKWLDYHFPKTFKNFYSTDWHDFKGGSRNKGSICSEQKIDLIIDDVPSYCMECLSVGTNVFLFDRAWNRNFETPEGITRVYSWNNIVDKINNY